MACSKLIQIKLENEELWRSFYRVSTEMIVTKTGRRMFPIVEVKVLGLEPMAIYAIALEFIQCGQYKMRYQDGYWSEASGQADPLPVNAIYRHTDSPNYGHAWGSGVISFTKIKITNKRARQPLSDIGLVHLNSLCKYYVCVHVLRVFDNSGSEVLIKSVKFPITEFIAVTAYQNEEVTALKVRYNPYAKAFQSNPFYRGSLVQALNKSIQAKRSNKLKSDQNSVATGPANVTVTPNGLAPYCVRQEVDGHRSDALSLTPPDTPNSTVLTNTSSFNYESVYNHNCYFGGPSSLPSEPSWSATPSASVPVAFTPSRSQILYTNAPTAPQPSSCLFFPLPQNNFNYRQQYYNFYNPGTVDDSKFSEMIRSLVTSADSQKSSSEPPTETIPIQGYNVRSDHLLADAVDYLGELRNEITGLPE